MMYLNASVGFFKTPSTFQAPSSEQIYIGLAPGQRVGRALAGDVGTFRARDRRLSVVSMESGAESTESTRAVQS